MSETSDTDNLNNVDHLKDSNDSNDSAQPDKPVTSMQTVSSGVFNDDSVDINSLKNAVADNILNLNEEFAFVSEQPENVENVEEVKDMIKSKVSFDDIDPRKLSFDFNYKCSRASAGQVVQGISHTGRYLSGTDEYDGEKQKPTENDFQKFLYPKIAEISSAIVDKYVEMFALDQNDNAVTKEVFGANLNGSHNDGKLNKPIVCKGVNPAIKYKFIQFKNLVNLLHHRMEFIANRNPLMVRRYKENDNERVVYQQLANDAKEFCKYLNESALLKWDEIINESRKFIPMTTSPKQTKPPLNKHAKPRSNTMDSTWKYVESRPRKTTNTQASNSATSATSATSVNTYKRKDD